MKFVLADSRAVSSQSTANGRGPTTLKHLLKLLLIFLLFGALPAGTALGTCVTDPMMQGQDPQIELKDHVYNLVQSDGCNIHLRRSSTLSGLYSSPNSVIFSPGCSNVWAPEIHWISTNWFLYYSSDTGGTGNERVHVAQSAGTNVFGPYTEKGVLFNGYWNIDGSVFFAPNGQLYFVCSGSPSGTQDICIAPMSNAHTLSGALTVISTPTQPWELNGSVNEGPFGFVRNGQLFIVYSASGCWTDDYCLGLLRLTGVNPLDPTAWTKTGPVFSKQPGAYGPGHNCILQDDGGQWWNVYHANNLSGQGCGGYRQLRAQRISWDLSNTPYFGTPVPLGSLITEDTNYLVCEFPLNETSGSSASTLVCGPSGTLQGSPVWMHPGLKLNGTNEYVLCNSALGNDVQSALTLAGWLKADAFTDWASVLTKGTNTSPYALQAWHDGSLRFTANWGSPPGSLGTGSWNSNAKMVTNAWYHVAVTYDGITVRFYLNGVLDSNQPAVQLRFGVVNEPITLGADLPGGHEFFDGIIRDVRLYGRALNDVEIGQIALSNHPPVLAPVSDKSLVAGQVLSVTNNASDPDAPPQTLSFSLLTAPAGAALNASNGVFTWRPSVSQANSTNLVTEVVSDNGSPPLTGTQNFNVVVAPPASPVITSTEFSSSGLQLTVTGDLGPDYSLFTSTNLDSNNWSLIVTTNPLAMPFRVSDPQATNMAQRFYRIELGP